MNTLDELIYYCKESEPTGALMLTGEWGCGKTHLIEHELCKELEKTHTVVRVSLFGIDSIDALNAAVKKEWIKACGGFLSKFQDHEKSIAVGKAIFGTVGAIAGSLLPVIKDATDAALAINPFDYVTVKNEIGNESEKKKVILVFDDLERSRLDTVAVLGCINEYCENQSFNTIIVANEERVTEKEKKREGDQSNQEIEKEGTAKTISYVEIKEKIVSRTVHHKPDFEKVVHTVINNREWFSPEYKQFLKDNELQILRIFRAGVSTDDSLTKPHNVRSLKCALQDFYRLFMLMTAMELPDMEQYLFTFIAYTIAAKAGIAKEGQFGYLFSDEDVRKLYPVFSSSTLLDGARRWIIYGDWDEVSVQKEIERIVENSKAPEPKEVLKHTYFSCLEEETIREGFCGLLEDCYSGKLTLNDYLVFIENSFLARKYNLQLPAAIDWTKVCNGIDIRFEFDINHRDDQRVYISLNPDKSYNEEERGAHERIEKFLKGNQLALRSNEREFINALKTTGVMAFPTYTNKAFDKFSIEMAEATADCFDCSEQANKYYFAGYFREMLEKILSQPGVDIEATKAGLDKLTELLKTLSSRYSNTGHKIAFAHVETLIDTIVTMKASITE